MTTPVRVRTAAIAALSQIASEVVRSKVAPAPAIEHVLLFLETLAAGYEGTDHEAIDAHLRAKGFGSQETIVLGPPDYKADPIAVFQGRFGKTDG